MDGNDDRRSSITSISANNASSNSSVKEIQVTAKEIVDRISSFQSGGSSGVEFTGVFDEKQVKPTGYVKPFTGGGSEPSACSSGDEKGDDAKSETKGSQSQDASPQPSASGPSQRQERPGRLSSKSSRFSVSSLTSESGSGSSIEQRAVEHLLDVVQVKKRFIVMIFV